MTYAFYTRVRIEFKEGISIVSEQCGEARSGVAVAEKTTQKLPNEYPNEISSDKRTMLSKECCFGSKRFYRVLYFLWKHTYGSEEESKAEEGAPAKMAGESCERNRTNDSQWLLLLEPNPISRKFPASSQIWSHSACNYFRSYFALSECAKGMLRRPTISVHVKLNVLSKLHIL